MGTNGAIAGYANTAGGTTMAATRVRTAFFSLLSAHRVSRRRQIAGSIVGWTKVKRKVIIQMFTSMPPLSPSNLCTTQKMCIILVSVVLCVVVDDSILYSHSTKKQQQRLTHDTHTRWKQGERGLHEGWSTHTKSLSVGRTLVCGAAAPSLPVFLSLVKVITTTTALYAKREET